MTKLPVLESNLRSIRNYETKIALAAARKDRADRRVVRAVNVMVRAANKLAYLKRQHLLVLEASEKGIPFHQPKLKKAQGIRVVDL